MEHGALFNGKVPSTVLNGFLRKGYSVTPDLYIPQYNDSSDKAFEMKIYGIHKEYKNYLPSSKKISPTYPRMVDDLGPKTVVSDYTTVATKLDKELANTSDHDRGPFLSALHTLHGGHVTPIVGGAFGECSKSADTLLKTCALKAAASEAGVELTPAPDNKQLLTARNILLHDFRLVVGCSILRANIDLKFKRLPFIRPSIPSAKNAVLINKKPHTHFQPDFHPWFRKIGDNGVYDSFYRYVNQRHHFGDHSPKDDIPDLHALV